MQKQSTRRPILGPPLWSRYLVGYLLLNDFEKSVPQLLASRDFLGMLKNETLRSDRTASPLSLILFDILNPSGKDRLRKAGLIRLARILCRRTRKIDIKGWYRDPLNLRVGLMLPNTPPANVERIIETVREAFRAEAARVGTPGAEALDLVCEVYSYPSGHYQGDPNRRQLCLFDDEELASGGPGWDGDGRGNGHGNGNGHQHAGDHGRDTYDAPARMRVGPIAQLLAGPLPLWKRSVDLVVSSVGLTLLAPLFALIAVAIKLTSRGPVFFKQARVGWLGREFMCWKFRSMRINADSTVHRQYLRSLIEHSTRQKNGESDPPMLKLDATDRQITAVGRILRASCLDELPQLINVFRGEMSLIGPRPCLPYEAEKYQLWHTRRLDVVPGITGLWQVMGKNHTTFPQMISLDIHYMRQRSFLFDMKILFMTIPTVFNELREWVAQRQVKEANNVQ